MSNPTLLWWKVAAAAAGLLVLVIIVVSVMAGFWRRAPDGQKELGVRTLQVPVDGKKRSFRSDGFTAYVVVDEWAGTTNTVLRSRIGATTTITVLPAAHR